MAAPKEKSTAITAIVFDTETGGLDCQKCGVIQVSFHAVRLDTFEVMEKLNVYIKRYSRPADLGKPKRKVLKSKYDKEEEVTDIPMEYGAAAEKVHGITKEMQERLGIEPVEACQMMIDFIKRNTLANGRGTKPFFIGQNPMFDEGMIEQLFVIAGLWEELIKLVRGNKDFWGNFHFAMLDTIIISQLTLNNDPSIAAWKLEKDGFTVASETRCTTPDAKYSYQMDYAFEDITYGFDGKVKHRSKEYSSKDIETRYGRNNESFKGLGVIRHSFYD